MPRTTSTQVKLLALLTAIGLACGAYSCNTGPIDNNNGVPNPNPTIQGSNLDAPPPPPPPDQPGGDDSAMVDCTITADPPNPCAPSEGNTACVPDTGPADYVWSVVGGTITAGQGTRCITYSVDVAGTIVISVVGTDAVTAEVRCECEGELEIEVPQGPECPITVEPPCPNSTGNVASIPDPGAGAVIVWQIQGGTITSGQGTASITFTAGAGVEVKLFVSVVLNGCTSLCKELVPILEGPVCDITAEAPCPNSTGNTASVAATAGATYVWTISGGTITLGQGTNSITYTAGASGIVALDVTVTANGCECSDSLDLTILTAPNCTITAADVCPNSEGNTASVPSAGAGATYVWTISGGTFTGPTTGNSVTFTAGASGTVHLEVDVTNAAGCECHGELDVDITSNLTCVIAEPTTGGVFTGTISGGDAPFSCSADFDIAGWVVDSCVVNNAGNGPGFTVNYHAEGGECGPDAPTLTVTITDDSGCETECSADVPCPPAGCVITGGGLICEGDTATLCVDATGNLPPVTIAWTGPNGFTASTDCITVSVPGVYTATVTDGNGMESVCCAPVAVLKLKGTQAPCANSTDLVFSAHVDSSGQATFAGTFEWSISGNGTFCDGTTTADGNPVCVDAGAAGSFVLSVTATGTLNFTCDGTATSEPAVVTCTRSVTVVSCP